jgi:dihydroxy-acid dehydratase
VDLPTIMVTGGPMLSGKYRGQDVGSGTQVWRLEAELIAGRMTPAECQLAEGAMARSQGHCMTMGTASTMACLAEAMGMQLPGSASWPAVDARRYETAQHAGQRIVELVDGDLRPSRIITRGALENAIRANAAIGGSTNAIIHLQALAGRLELPLELDDFDKLTERVPTIVDLMPSGRFLMEDFCYAGGVPVVLRELIEAGLFDGSQLTVTGRTIADEVETAECWNRGVIRSFDDPLLPAGSGTAVLRGNLCPDGAVIKQSAASPHLLRHSGRAVVFDSPEEYHDICDSPDLAVERDDILVIRGAGPKGYPGMPEVANVPIPRKLLDDGVTDMVRISDGRMSGTAYGTVVLHVAPEAAVGGPLALMRTGDRITLDVPSRTLTLDVPDSELSRRAAWQAPAAAPTGGYDWLYLNHVQQADKGADFDFLVGRRGAAVPRDSH